MEGYSPEPGEIIEEKEVIEAKKKKNDYDDSRYRHGNRKRRRSHSRSSSYDYSRRRKDYKRRDYGRRKEYSSSSITSKRVSNESSSTRKEPKRDSNNKEHEENNNEHSTINIDEVETISITDNNNKVQNKEDRRKRIEAIKQKHQLNKDTTPIGQSSNNELPIKEEDIKQRQDQQESFIKYINHERELLTQDNIQANHSLLPLPLAQVQENNNPSLNDDSNYIIESPVTPDMFADEPIKPTPNNNPNNKPQEKNPTTNNNQAIDLSFFNQTESIGYYIPQMNEMITSKYKVIGLCGKGIFSSVVKVLNITNHIEYALKIIRDISIMKASGDKEKSIISQLNKEDPEDKSNIIRMKETFEFNNHLCMIFDLYQMNLRDLLKNTLKTQGRAGIPMNQLKSFIKQLIQGFILIHKNRLIHADFKPDNTVINAGGDHLRICDFGSAFYEDEAIITSELVSRYYRAPEIILGLKPNQKIDIWSLGCTIYELYTGTILFPGRSNNEMIKLVVQSKGKVSKKFIKRCSYGSEYFSSDGNYFKSKDFDSKLNCDVIRDVDINQLKQKDIVALLKESKRGKGETDMKSFGNLGDLLTCCLAIDPYKRISAIDAYSHPFLII